MGIKADDNPFTAGVTRVPAPMAGREDETERLTLMLNRLSSPRAKIWGELTQPPYPPIKIVGPRGVGKTTLQNWAKQQAKKRGIRCVSCAGLRPNETDFLMHQLLADISVFYRVRSWFKGFSLSVAEQVGAGVELNQASTAFKNVVGFAVRRGPLLLLMDEVQHYDLALLRAVLQGSQKLIGDGYPLGLVLAGTPGLDSHLAKAESTFIIRSRNLYINALSDAATRDALRLPFEQAGVKVTPDALEAMAAQTDNYPYFIQLVGTETWNELAKSGREEVDVEMVRQSEDKARKGREDIYAQAYDRIADNGLLPQARQVMEMFDRNGGEMKQENLIGALVEANAGVDDKRAREICASLREDGFIWTVRGKTSPGIPSFFNYCREQQRDKEAS